MSNPTAIAKLFSPELNRIRNVYGDDLTMAVIQFIDRRVEADARKAPGSTITVDVDWEQIDKDLRTHQATSVGQKVADQRAADLIQLTPEGLAKIIAASRQEGESVTDIEWTNLGETGKPTRMTRRGRR